MCHQKNNGFTTFVIQKRIVIVNITPPTDAWPMYPQNSQQTFSTFCSSESVATSKQEVFWRHCSFQVSVNYLCSCARWAESFFFFFLCLLNAIMSLRSWLVDIYYTAPTLKTGNPLEILYRTFSKLRRLGDRWHSLVNSKQHELNLHGSLANRKQTAAFWATKKFSRC